MAKNDTEIELKVVVSSKKLEKLFQHFSKQAIGDIRHKCRPRAYYDTEDKDLRQRNISLRVQYKLGKNGKLGGFEQTIKFSTDKDAASAKKDGVLIRKEWKDWLEGPEPSFDMISNKQAQELLEDLDVSKLCHLFTAIVERRYFEIEVNKGKKGPKGVVELAFDVGHIALPALQGQGYKELFEIEIELKSGDPAIVDVVKEQVLDLAAKAYITTDSKADIGHDFQEKANRKIESKISTVKTPNKQPKR